MSASLPRLGLVAPVVGSGMLKRCPNEHFSLVGYLAGQRCGETSSDVTSTTLRHHVSKSNRAENREPRAENR